MSVTYSEIASLEGYLLWVSRPWSQRGYGLVFEGHDGLYFFDAAAPDREPVRILDQDVRYIAWSPDGRWVLCKTPRDDGKWSLYAVPTDGRPEIPLLDSQDIGDFHWGEDGYVYWWHDRSGERRQVEPPDPWREEARRGPPVPVRPVLIRVTSGLRGYDHFVFRATPGEPPSQKGLKRFDADTIEHDAFPVGERFLVNVRGYPSAYDIVMDSDEQIVVDFRDHPEVRVDEGTLTATSVSSDGRYIAADQSVDDGHDILRSEVYLLGSAANWLIPIANVPPMARKPYLSRSGHLIAFEDLKGHVHVGRLEFTRR
jgi:hypothetical protein